MLVGVGILRRFRRKNHRQLATVEQGLDFLAVQHFTLEQGFGDANQYIGVFRDVLLRLVIAALDQVAHFGIDTDSRCFAVVAVLRDLTAQEDLFLLLAEGQRAHGTHAPLADHLTRHRRGLFDIVPGAGRHEVEEHFLGDASTHQNSEP